MERYIYKTQIVRFFLMSKSRYANSKRNYRIEAKADIKYKKATSGSPFEQNQFIVESNLHLPTHIIDTVEVKQSIACK